MEFQIGKYTIKSDSLNWTLYENRTVQDGENVGATYQTPEGYYPTMGSLLLGLLDRKLRESDVATIREVLDALKEAKETILTGVEERSIPTTNTTPRIASPAPREVEDGVYPLPGKILELMDATRFKVREKKRKGRGFTAYVEISEDERPELVRQIQDRMQNAAPNENITLKRALSVLGTV